MAFSNFSSAIRIEYVLSLNVSYASDFVLLSLCYVHHVAEAVPINSESGTISAKIGQILAIKQQIQSSIMSYSPNSHSKKSAVLSFASHSSMYA